MTQKIEMHPQHLSTQPAPWNIRAYRPGDEAALVDLFKRAFDRTITANHWRWKFKQLPSPVENVWLAMAHDQPISQHPGLPVRYRFPGGEQTAMVLVDIMTDPTFQRQGILTKLGQFTYDTWREAGIPFIVALPNERWGSRTRALGWQVIFPLQWLIRPLRPEVDLARRLKMKRVSRLTLLSTIWNAFWQQKIPSDPTVQIRPVNRAEPAFDILWQACAAEHPISVVRDSAWIRWRYLTPPAFAYHMLLAERSGQPVGYLVYRLAETAGAKLGFIADLFTPRAEAGARQALINHAVALLYRSGAKSVLTLAVPGTWLHVAFKQAGFILSKGAFEVQLNPLASDLPLEIFRNPQHWYLTGGDFDVI